MFVERLLTLLIGMLVGLAASAWFGPGWTLAVSAVGTVGFTWLAVVRAKNRKQQAAPKVH